MKKFFQFFVVLLSLLIILQPLSPHLVSAKDLLDQDGDLVENAIDGEDFDWSNVEWEVVEDTINNEEYYYIDEDEHDLDEYEYIDLDEDELYSTEFEFIFEDDPRFEEEVVQIQIWGLIARVVLSGGKHVVKYGSKLFKKQPTSTASNHLKNFQPARVNIGGNNTIVLQKSSMSHILTRHHPKYWTGTIDKTLFNPSISSGKIRSQIITIINRNKSQIRNGYGTINVKIDGQKYRLVISNYRVNTFYPVR